MASSSSSYSSTGGNQRVHYGEIISPRYCQCGQELKMLISWTTENPGRRYWHCAKLNGLFGCGFFDWFDPPICQRAKKIIPGLLKRINRNEEEIQRLKAMVRAAEESKCWWRNSRVIFWGAVVLLVSIVFLYLRPSTVGKGSKLNMLPLY